MEKPISLTVVAAPLYVPSYIGWALRTAKTLHPSAALDQLGEKDLQKRVGCTTQSAIRWDETGTEVICNRQVARGSHVPPVRISAGSASVGAARRVLTYGKTKTKAEAALPCPGHRGSRDYLPLPPNHSQPPKRGQHTQTV